tara:strand:+ start:27846 stop:28193 length:348 start_codon:yes stop_codon:yes gene_type:complete
MSPVAAFLALEYQDAEKAARAGRIDQAWHHLERAHIVAQTRLLAHCRSHWTMLLFAVRLGDWREGAGQIFRLALAPLGNLTGRLPVGNSGRANVSAFVAMEIPSDLRSILDTDSE